MLTETLEKELGAYHIGEKVRDLRLQRGLRLVELGEHTGLSAAMLSKIERGKLVPTLPTLMRIALVFSVGLDYFFSEQKRRHAFAIVRKEDRIALPAGLNQKAVPYTFESLDYEALEPRINAFLAHFQPIAGDPPQHVHAGIEFIYITTGNMQLIWGGDTYDLHAGDSVYFDSSIEHGYRRLGNEPCTGVVVTQR